ncbi:MAG: ADP-ribosylglycohydrolase family protein [Planctomycetota bacterium]|nr:ADP-ribosylglycohydrolase family protein [Planctomycetota bacterium]MCX8040594.1 ADP-ribosylglycohydrolase family protein [Planctomycetota bacterium]MDW8373066.1 ADP-ribosylglycohydrolase family protein [Planctomycetota bacterium]
MLGAIAGDIAGSRFEFHNYRERPPDADRERLFTSDTEETVDRRQREVSHFTDDTVMTIAVADALLHERDMATTLRAWGQRYPGRGYGGRFRRWLEGELPDGYGSWGNGAAMRASPAGHFATSVEEALALAERTALPTHNHPEGIAGAQAVALGVFLLRAGATPAAVGEELTRRFAYDLSRPLAWYEAHNEFDESCRGTIPVAFAAFIAAQDFAGALRHAIRCNGDTDTIAAVAGAWAEAAWGVPPWIRREVERRLPAEMLSVLARAEERSQRTLRALRR